MKVNDIGSQHTDYNKIGKIQVLKTSRWPETLIAYVHCVI